MCHNILIDSTIIDCLIISHQFQLDTIGKLARQQAHIALEEFKKVSGFGEQQRLFGLLYIICRKSHARITKPKETILVRGKTSLFIEALQNETLILGIQF